MGYDVTYHAISDRELHRYVYEVLKKPKLIRKRVKEITDNPEKQKSLVDNLYDNALIPWAINGKTDDGTTINSENFPNSISFVIAAIASYLHPFWYARNSVLSFLFSKTGNSIFTCHSDIDGSPFSRLGLKGCENINVNYSASGPLQNPQNLLNCILETKDELLNHIGEDEFDSLTRALKYCIERRLWLIEATDLVVPLSNTCDSDFENFRAHFLDNVEKELPPIRELTLMQRFFN